MTRIRHPVCCNANSGSSAKTPPMLHNLKQTQFRHSYLYRPTAIYLYARSPPSQSQAQRSFSQAKNLGYLPIQKCTHTAARVMQTPIGRTVTWTTITAQNAHIVRALVVDLAVLFGPVVLPPRWTGEAGGSWGRMPAPWHICNGCVRCTKLTVRSGQAIMDPHARGGFGGDMRCVPYGRGFQGDRRGPIQMGMVRHGMADPFSHSRGLGRWG